MMKYKGEQDWQRTNPLVESNCFRKMKYEEQSLPTFEEAKSNLPEPIISQHPDWKALYYRAWELAFKNFRRPEPNSGFVSNYIDTAFNDDTFLWDSCFMTMFGKYCHPIFPMINTLDNFYAKQHSDGFICRTINTFDGEDYWSEFDPDATGPNITAWTEWTHYLNYGDKERLGKVFPALMAYHEWFREFRTWPNGLYWATGFASGMDCQTRVPDSIFYHRHYAWADTCMQAALNSMCLCQIATEIGKRNRISELKTEYDLISKLVNKYFWDEATGFYFDLAPNGNLSTVKSVGMFWGLLADLIPEERRKRFLLHLSDEKSFKTLHRVPAQSIDSEAYLPLKPYGWNWIGCVWPPTNYMIMKGLRRSGERRLAHEIALNHVENVLAVFKKCGKICEFYAPEIQEPVMKTPRDFVGWGGLGPISVLLEDIIGINGNWNKNTIEWDVRLLEEHGVIRYPFGPKYIVSLSCRTRTSEGEPPSLQIDTPIGFVLKVTWGDSEKSITVVPGKKEYNL